MKSLVIAMILFTAAAIAIWAIFLRPIPVHTGFGTIARKTFKPEGTYWRYPSDPNRGFRMATPIPIAEAYVFEITAGEFKGPIFFSLNTTASKAFEVGQRVQIQYRERSVPFIGKRLYVLDMRSIGR